MTATATARINVVNHMFVATDTNRCGAKGCYAGIKHHADYVTAVYNTVYAAAVTGLPGAVSVGKLVACHAFAAKRVAEMFNVR